MTRPNLRFIVTGGPGAGKTTLLNALAADGVFVLPDEARRVIRSRLSAGLSPRPAPVAFAQAVYAADVANYDRAPAGELSLFDRGVVDSIGSLRFSGAFSQAQADAALAHYPYNPRVFVLPAWEAIYRTDSERDQTFDEAVAVYHSVKGWYARCGYTCLEVPIGPLAERVAFVQSQLPQG